MMILLHILCIHLNVLSGYRHRNANIRNAIRVKVINFIAFHFTFFSVDVIRRDSIWYIVLIRVQLLKKQPEIIINRHSILSYNWIYSKVKIFTYIRNGVEQMIRERNYQYFEIRLL